MSINEHMLRPASESIPVQDPPPANDEESDEEDEVTDE
jgi:hypothetical protein